MGDFPITGIAYYTREAYAQLLQGADDRSSLCDTWEEWLLEYEKALNGLKKEGLEVYPYLMDMHELKAWCKSRRISNTGKSRAAFVSAKMSMRHKPD
jgi:hypothetical protein